MSLQDAHLKQALKSAPDRDLAPKGAVRQKVLDYAQNAAQAKHEGWLKRCFSALNNWQIKSWQLVGMSTVASVFLVMVMVRPQLPDELKWVNSDEQDIALTEEVDSATASNVQQEKLIPLSKEETFSPPTDADLSKRLEESRVAQRGDSLNTKAKKSARTERKIVKKRAERIEKPVVELSDKGAAAAAVPAKSSSDVIAIAAEAEAVGELVLEDKAVLADTSGKMENIDTAVKPSIAARSRVAPARQSVSGVALAKKDIQSGNLRILFAGDSWPAGKLLVDEETGLRIELTRMAENEVTTYNQTMRDWYRVNRGLSN